MTGNFQFYVILYKNVSSTMKSEKILKEKKVPYKLIPVPKKVSSNCGICIRFKEEDKQDIIDALNGEVVHTQIVKI